MAANPNPMLTYSRVVSQGPSPPMAALFKSPENWHWIIEGEPSVQHKAVIWQAPMVGENCQTQSLY